MECFCQVVRDEPIVVRQILAAVLGHLPAGKTPFATGVPSAKRSTKLVPLFWRATAAASPSIGSEKRLFEVVIGRVIQAI
jgi:hypothetical protein